MENLAQTAKSLVASKKGLLAADESTKTIQKRFSEASLISTPELNYKYRRMLFATPGIEEFLSGIIFFDETVKQAQGKLLEVIREKGIIPGIKVDEGSLPFGEGKETVAKGLDGLENRLDEYKKMELKFTKFRAAFSISDICPSKECIEENTSRFVEFVKISQARGFVPIIEPEVLMEGNHTTTRCESITTLILKTIFNKLEKEGEFLEGLILKVNMVLPGKDSGVKVEPLEVANATLRTLKNSVPERLPGVVFLSGGQSAKEATANLDMINKLGKDAPWQLSFSYARALQGEALREWLGKDENVKIAREVFLKRLKLVSLARQGLYSKDMEESFNELAA